MRHFPCRFRMCGCELTRLVLARRTTVNDIGRNGTTPEKKLCQAIEETIFSAFFLAVKVNCTYILGVYWKRGFVPHAWNEWRRTPE